MKLERHLVSKILQPKELKVRIFLKSDGSVVINDLSEYLLPLVSKLNLMGHYQPFFKAHHYSELKHALKHEEYEFARAYAVRMGVNFRGSRNSE
jgi:uncharacterized Fe-S radical SAM superfamily protein PflX